MTQSCHTPNCACHYPLYTVAGFRGRVEVKCPRCKTVHDFLHGSTQSATREVRCYNSFKGLDAGGWCGQLVMRMSQDASGAIGYTCPRCRNKHTIRIDTPVLAFST